MSTDRRATLAELHAMEDYYAMRIAGAVALGEKCDMLEYYTEQYRVARAALDAWKLDLRITAR